MSTAIPSRIIHHQRWRKLRKWRAKIRARFGDDIPSAQVEHLAHLLLNDRLNTREEARQRLERKLESSERTLKMFDIHGENNVGSVETCAASTTKITQLRFGKFGLKRCYSKSCVEINRTLCLALFTNQCIVLFVV